jgi:hypothetical protein
MRVGSRRTSREFYNKLEELFRPSPCELCSFHSMNRAQPHFRGSARSDVDRRSRDANSKKSRPDLDYFEIKGIELCQGST